MQRVSLVCLHQRCEIIPSDSDFDSFSQGLPRGFKDGKKLYLDVRKHMGIREERDMGEMTDFESLRDMYLTGKDLEYR